MVFAFSSETVLNACAEQKLKHKNNKDMITFALQRCFERAVHLSLIRCITNRTTTLV